VKCRLVTGKTQIALKVKITILRMELVAAINLARLTRKGQGTSENVHKVDQVLYRFLMCTGDATDGIGQVQ
jgi:hypothetical protein